VDELMALCDRLEAQQQERETRHAALARASLARFADAPTPANLHFLFHPSYAISPADLRKSILTLAVQGKLVPQDPNDEPADELLKRIAAEQERLVKARQIRRLETAPLNEDEEPFGIPANWAWTRLGQIGDWGSGSTPPRGNHELYGGGIAWLKSGELNDNRTLAGSEETVTELAVKTCSFRLNKPGDVLLAMYGATIGKAAILAEPAVTNQAVCGCTPFPGVLNTYLFDYLLSQRDAFHAASEGGAQPNISKVKIVGYPFPLPPLAEQRRIVAKVEHLMALVDALETQLATSRATAEKLLAAVVAELTEGTHASPAC
jgi:type I restriction enzyme S subunit